MRFAVWWLAFGFFATGLVLAVLPVQDFEGADCGVAFSAAPEPESNDPERSEEESAECVQLRNQARQLPVALLVAGGVALLSQVRWRWPSLMDKTP